jgi:hypothetical protein
MTGLQILQCVLEVLILLLGLYLTFFKSYFQEKAKNLATKEDIGEITQTVEKIKNQLSYSTQSKLSLNTEVIHFWSYYFYYGKFNCAVRDE